MALGKYSRRNNAGKGKKVIVLQDAITNVILGKKKGIKGNKSINSLLIRRWRWGELILRVTELID